MVGGLKPNKSLGQHWLTDTSILQTIVKYARIKSSDTVLEIGPGLGTLTKELLKTNASVVAVEFDNALAKDLTKILLNSQNVSVINQDILKFNLTSLPPNYIVVANIPYYLTSKLIRNLSESSNPPKTAVLLVQKEVALRACASPGDMSLLSVSANVYFDCSLGVVVPAEYFTPPPKVDSQVLILNRLNNPKVNKADQQQFFRIVKAGFSERRKKLRSSLSGGLAISKEQADTLLSKANIDASLRAQNLSINDWQKLAKAWQELKY